MLTARRILINTFLSFFYGLLVTGDETWVCNWDPEGKQESMAYITSRFSVIPNIKDHGKDMGYLPPKTTMKGAYYSEAPGRIQPANSLVPLRPVRILCKRLYANVALEFAGNLSILQASTPSDIFLLLYLKEHLRQHRFHDDGALKETVERYFQGRDENLLIFRNQKTC